MHRVCVYTRAMSDAPTTELENLSKTTPPPTPEAQGMAPVSQGPVTKEDARAALETIAKPQVEATPEAQENPRVDGILTEASQMYLDAKDNRLLLTVLSRQTAGTPLGDELRRDTLEMIRNSNLPGFDDLKKEIADMNLTKTDPAQSQLVSFLERFNVTHPGGEVPAELIEAVKTGKMESAPLVARALQENSALSEQLWTEMAGKDKPRPQLTTPDGLLGAAGLEKNDANRSRAEAMLTPLKMKKDWNVNLGDMVPSVLGGMMLLSFVTQLAMTDSGQSQGHQ